VKTVKLMGITIYEHYSSHAILLINTLKKNSVLAKHMVLRSHQVALVYIQGQDMTLLSHTDLS